MPNVDKREANTSVAYSSTWFAFTDVMVMWKHKRTHLRERESRQEAYPVWRT